MLISQAPSQIELAVGGRLDERCVCRRRLRGFRGSFCSLIKGVRNGWPLSCLKHRCEEQSCGSQLATWVTSLGP